MEGDPPFGVDASTDEEGRFPGGGTGQCRGVTGGNCRHDWDAFFLAAVLERMDEGRRHTRREELADGRPV